MPTMLLVDTCGLHGGVMLAAWDDAQESLRYDVPLSPRILAERSLPGRETQERLMTALADVLEEASLRPVDLDVLAVVSGPGSFTGVRIGMAAIKGLAEALGRPVVAVSRLAVLAAQAPDAARVKAWLDAGRGDVFEGIYRDGVCLGEAMVHGSAALDVVRDGDIVVVMEDALHGPPRGTVRVPPVGVREALPLAVAEARARRFADTALLDANYLRVPDAELNRRAKLAAAATLP